MNWQMSDSTAARACAPQASHLKDEPPGDPNILPTDRSTCCTYSARYVPPPTLTDPPASPAQHSRRLHRACPPNCPPAHAGVGK